MKIIFGLAITPNDGGNRAEEKRPIAHYWHATCEARLSFRNKSTQNKIMDESPVISGPPKLPPPLPAQELRAGNSFAYQAAKFSLWAPFVVFFLNTFTRTVLRNPGSAGQMSALLIISIGGLFLLCGLILGIMALSRMGQYGRKGIFGRSLTGVILNGIGIAALVMIPLMNRVKERAENQKAYVEMSRSVKAINEEAKRELNKGSGTSSAPERLNRMQKAMEKATQGMKGEDALVAKVTQGNLQKMQKIVEAYTKALVSLQKPPILDMSGVTRREELDAKRMLVKAFLKENEKFTIFIQNGESNFTEELKEANISQRMIDSTLKGYREKEHLRGTVLKIRKSDLAIGESWLKLLDLLAESWGKWKFSEEQGMVLFEDESTLEKYNVLVREVQAIAAEQASLQKQVVRQL